MSQPRFLGPPRTADGIGWVYPMSNTDLKLKFYKRLRIFEVRLTRNTTLHTAAGICRSGYENMGAKMGRR